MTAVRDDRILALTRELAPHFDALRGFRTRAQLEASALWAQIGGDVATVLDGLARGDRDDPAPVPAALPLRAVAWNIQRGANLDGVIAAFREDPELARADVILLSEVDVGMGRSGNRDVARELAGALGMSYAFAVSYIALEDDYLENPDNVANTLALAGSAILSRAPILRAINADLPALRDKFSSKSEKRLGKKRAVVVEIATERGPIVVAQAHLDSNASSPGRARQLAALIAAADSLGNPRLLVGGDLNTTTYAAASTLSLVRDLVHKLFVTGFAGTIDNYLTPDRRYELPVFAELRAHDLVVDGFNQRGAGTLVYDFTQPYAIEKVRSHVGGLLTRWLVRRLRRWNGVVPAHLDWFAGRGVVASHPQIVRIARVDGKGASDHDPIAVDIDVADQRQVSP